MRIVIGAVEYKTEGERRFDNMRAIVRGIYPQLSDAQVTYACNQVGNVIRKKKCDIYDLTLSSTPIHAIRESELTFSIEVAGLTIYAWAATD